MIRRAQVITTQSRNIVLSPKRYRGQIIKQTGGMWWEGQEKRGYMGGCRYVVNGSGFRLDFKKVHALPCVLA